MQTIDAARRALAEGRMSARALTDAALARAQDSAGEGPRAFTRLYAEGARAAADAADRLAKAGGTPAPLAGVPISVQDLFDIPGEITLAGSVALKPAPAAVTDAVIVRRLPAAGAVIVGQTNMTRVRVFPGLNSIPIYGRRASPWTPKTGATRGVRRRARGFCPPTNGLGCKRHPPGVVWGGFRPAL